jgi:hypothetical protein
MTAAPIARGGETVTEWCYSAYPSSPHKPRVFSYAKREEDVPSNPTHRPPIDLDITYEWYGDSCVMHFRPSSFPERGANAHSNLHSLRHFENYYEWVPVPDTRTARNRRAHRTLRPPVWSGEVRPCGARRVSADADYPAMDYLAYLCRDLGYSITAAIAAVAVSTSQFITDRRSSSISEDEDQDEQFPCVDFHKIVDPSHPYIASAPSRRTLLGGGITIERVTRKLRNHNWSLAIQEAVIQVIAKRRSPRQMALERQLKCPTLKAYVSVIRRELKVGLGADLHADVS